MPIAPTRTHLPEIASLLRVEDAVGEQQRRITVLLKGFERIGVVTHLREEKEFARHRLAPVARRFYSRIERESWPRPQQSGCDVPIGRQNVCHGHIDPQADVHFWPQADLVSNRLIGGEMLSSGALFVSRRSVRSACR